MECDLQLKTSKNNFLTRWMITRVYKNPKKHEKQYTEDDYIELNWVELIGEESISRNKKEVCVEEINAKRAQMR